MHKPFRLIKAEGSPYEVGFTHGREAGDLVDLSAKLYRSLFQTVAGLEWGQVTDLAARMSKIMEDYDPGLWSELQGIAAGSEQPLETIVALNARTDILRLAGKDLQNVKLEGCTAAACVPDATVDGQVLLGQNWDTNVACLDTTIILAAKISGQPDIIILTEAGIVMRSGLNSVGVGVTGNALRSDQDYAEGLGVPVSFLRRRILLHDNLPDAIREVSQSRRTHSNNHLIASARGDAVNLEAAPKDVFHLHPQDGIIVHANHFLCGDAAGRLTDLGPESSPDSLYRQKRVESHLEHNRGRIGISDLQTAFRDHYGLPESVCRHPKMTDEGSMVGTVASVIMDLTNLRMFVARGPVCENEYTEYAFD